MPRELTNLEVDSFLERHPDVQRNVRLIDNDGYTAAPLAYPHAGMAIKDPSGRYVLVWRDASRRWHYIDLADMTLMNTIATQINQPAYVSDPDYIGAIRDALEQAAHVTVDLSQAVLVLGVLLLVFPLFSSWGRPR